MASRAFRSVLPLILVIGAACLFAFGYLLGDPGLILQKAVRICLECIGVG